MDLSEHRLFQAAPLVFIQYEADETKIQRRCADLTALEFSDCTADLVVFCQALYMFDGPTEMLCNVHRLLKPGGVVMIACENIESPPPWHTENGRSGTCFVEAWIRRRASAT